MKIIDKIKRSIVSAFVPALALAFVGCMEAELDYETDTTIDTEVEFYIKQHDGANYQLLDDYDSETGLSISYAATKLKFIVPNVDGRWALELPYSSRAWCTADVTEGTGPVEINLDFAENTAYESRSSEFTFTTQNTEVIVLFKQASAPEAFKSIFDDNSSFYISWNDPQELVVEVVATYTPTGETEPTVSKTFVYNEDGKADAGGVDFGDYLTEAQMLTSGVVSIQLKTYTDYIGKVEAEYIEPGTEDDDEPKTYTDAADYICSVPFDGGDGSTSSPFEISKARHLMMMPKYWAAYRQGNGQAYNFKQTADVVCDDGYTYESTGVSKSFPFDGEYDGNNRSITNFSLTVTYDSDILCAGLFGYASGANIHDLTMKNTTISAWRNVGAIIGYAWGATTVTNCALEGGEITGYGCANPMESGLIWSTKLPFGSTIIDAGYDETDSVISGVISLGTFGAVGGIIGTAIPTLSGGSERITVENCTSSCYVYGSTNPYASNGSTPNYGRFGGIIGYARNGVDVTNCSNTNHTGKRHAGTSSSTTQQSDVLVGGIVGVAMNDVNITDCYNTAAIDGSGFSGGILGYGCNDVHLRRCYVDDLGDENVLCAVSSQSGVLVGVMLGDNNSIYQCYTDMGWMGGPNGPNGALAGVLADTDVAYCYTRGNMLYTSNGKLQAAPLVGSCRISSTKSSNVNIYSCYTLSDFSSSNSGFLAYDGNGIETSVIANILVFNTTQYSNDSYNVLLNNLATANINDGFSSTLIDFVYPFSDSATAVLSSNSASGFATWYAGYSDRVTQYNGSYADMCTIEFIEDVLGDADNVFWQYTGGLPTLTNTTADIVFPAE